MTLSLIKPAGWAFGELLTSGQVEALDASQARGIDGVGGGTYAPTAKIIINGQGLQVTSLTVTGTLTLNGNTAIGNSSSDALSVLATSTFSSPVTFNDDITINQNAGFFADVIFNSGASVSMLADVQLGDDSSDTITIDGTLTANSPAAFNDTAEFWGNVSVHSGGYFHALGDAKLGSDSSNNLQLLGSLSNALSLTGAGRVPFSDGGILPDSDATITAAMGQIFRINPGAVAYRTYTLSNSGATAGDWMLFWQGGGNSSVSANGARIKSPTPDQNLATDLFTGKNSQYALYVYDHGGWYLALSSQF